MTATVNLVFNNGYQSGYYTVPGSPPDATPTSAETHSNVTDYPNVILSQYPEAMVTIAITLAAFGSVISLLSVVAGLCYIIRELNKSRQQRLPAAPV